MENLNVQPTAPQCEAPVTQKLPYAPPQAAFVPLKLEERLFTGMQPSNTCGYESEEHVPVSC